MWTPLVVALGGRLAFGDSLPAAFGGASFGMLAGAGKFMLHKNTYSCFLLPLTYTFFVTLLTNVTAGKCGMSAAKHQRCVGVAWVSTCVYEVEGGKLIYIWVNLVDNLMCVGWSWFLVADAFVGGSMSVS